MLKKIIERPVLASVISLLLVIFGIVGIIDLPITRFPEIAPPSVSVTTSYPGGNAETVASSVLLPLEEAINGVEDMTYMRSIANNSGSGTISVFFKPGTDPDVAAVNIQNRISKVSNRIPPEVNESGISVVKRLSGNIMTINLFSDSPDSSYDETFLQAYARINVIRELLRIDGVASADLLRGRDYAMRVWLNPEKLALYNLTPQDVIAEIRDQNFESAPGGVGENSEEAFEAVFKHGGRFNIPEEYMDLVIKTNEDGSLLHLRDIARVEFGASNYNSDNKVDGNPGITINISQTNDSNAREIDEQVRKVLEENSKLFPEGIDYAITYSVKDQIDQSINQVIKTIFEAFILVFVVVLVFLQNFKFTLIPAITVPVSLIGTFFFLQLMGFSINVLTMFALVLSIGIVVDDAIIVVEAVHEKMHSLKLSAKKATIAAMKEITTPIISITIVLIAVFVPVGFMDGPVGIFYRQFAYTIVFAVLISALNALTLSPVLSVLFYRKRKRKRGPLFQRAKNSESIKKVSAKTDKWFGFFNRGFAWFTHKYINVVRWTIGHKWYTAGALVLVLAGTGFMFYQTPKGFIPTEDDSFLSFSLAMPAGSSLYRTTKALTKADSIIRMHEAVSSVNTVSGYNVVDASNSPSFGMGYISLKDKKHRGDIDDINDVIRDLSEKLAVVDEASINLFTRPTVQGFGDISGLEFVLQDRSGGDFSTFGQTANEFVIELNRRPEIANAFTSFDANFPQYKLNIDYQKAKSMGVSVKDMMRTIQTYFGRVQSGDFNRFGRQYRVYMQSDFQFRDNAKSINSIFVKNDKDEMVPVNALVSVEQTFGPEIVNRYNLYNAISVNATPAKGYSTGDAMNAIEEIAREKLPGNYSYEWTGISLEEEQSGSETAMIFVLSLVVVFFILAAQYESYWLPWSVLLSLPCGLLGVFLAINLAGIENNIYVQVGIIMLVGLLAKNAILIVEFVVQKRKNGLSVLESVISASEQRIRPILMTSMAFIAGLIPLMFTTGSSAEGNKSVSVGAAGGMILGVCLGVLVIPALAYMFQTIHEKLHGTPDENNDDE
ncbi:efflux RND transporter permease subunit [Sinomicrobium soli]|uniref:efflux RND transporter permease subunit n=1 Tax=Sinomicrobium sp. N-1-3-6 TaxID=2219864 RepID=UPI000DCD8C89|nr:efflux RND transporter permease subunit [Sinomicrobium sp. N-1-3-6]RAV30944.1 hydrophobe/amphiphile efflux-1 family RND transporter [Sinomicrobium sp. N-1-3-6]